MTDFFAEMMNVQIFFFERAEEPVLRDNPRFFYRFRYNWIPPLCLLQGDDGKESG